MNELNFTLIQIRFTLSQIYLRILPSLQLLLTIFLVTRLKFEARRRNCSFKYCTKFSISLVLYVTQLLCNNIYVQYHNSIATYSFDHNRITNYCNVIQLLFNIFPSDLLFLLFYIINNVLREFLKKWIYLQSSNKSSISECVLKFVYLYILGNFLWIISKYYYWLFKSSFYFYFHQLFNK